MKTIQPIGDKILVEPIKNDTKTSSGIYLPDNASDKGTKLGKVLAIGDDKLLAGKLNINDTIIIASYAGNELELDGRKYLLVTLNDILGKLKEYQPIKK